MESWKKLNAAIKNDSVLEDLAEYIHSCYLDCVELLPETAYNPNAKKPFAELTEEQRFIDRFLALRIKYRTQ